MRAFIPVKRSERLPGKHFLKLGDRRIIDIVFHKVNSVTDARIVSTFPVDLPSILDNSKNIMQLLHSLSRNYDEFMLIAGDMPFFTVDDLMLLLDSYRGRTVIPKHKNGKIEPLFAIYSGTIEMGTSLTSMVNKNTQWIDASKFSDYAFLNINTMNDYQNALLMMKKYIK
ncbi:MAG: hypothetical protein M1315_03670 [Candidatus Thermoplasmatota archaeon]|nr:hypothetical protein [Candidatus Thermoplasmatota archaeon]